ncbi:ATPase [Thioploca ingrica]|uniref:histidine kinase n=1 Tax=Thioploca ingrica TaxID=40754 RepID=A0A090AHM4_9GAMM|nr:ATPase [Thioploca ingrica]
MKLPHHPTFTCIYESANTLVYRLFKHQAKKPLIFKVLRKDYPTVEELKRYQHEYKILRHLNAIGIIKAYGLKKYQNTLVLILEDFGGESLKQWLAITPLTINQFLPIALQITESLEQIHVAQVIHKDINPSNIIINRETKQLKIIDFNISTYFPIRNPAGVNPNPLEGTLAYISPEQTGRINQLVDYRTDLYSLGITFYELLTGQVPFDYPDPLELIHCHLAKIPTPLHQINPAIPPIIANIIMKLMAKNVEQRYQSAAGVKADLAKCLQQLESFGTLDRFQFDLASDDFSAQFEIPQRFYGREPEQQALLHAFERTVQGNSELLLIAGYPGVGKSALVHEMSQAITEKRGHFISGKFQQYQQNVPYSAVSATFNQFCHDLLSENLEQLTYWRQTLLSAVGNNGQILIEVIPALEAIIGKQPAVAQIKPIQTQNRFNLVFQRLVRSLAQASHPLVLFIDDWQWADVASLELLSNLMTDKESHYLLIIAAYRDNEINASHPLMITVEKLQIAQVIINTILVSNFSIAEVNALIADTLKSAPTSTLRLTQVVYDKTQGNAFFTQVFLTALYEQGLLHFNWQTRHWQWDIDKITAQDFTDNVVALLVDKITRLPPDTQTVLKLAACIGNPFKLQTLSWIYYPDELLTTFVHLWKAIAMGLISVVQGSLPVSRYRDHELLQSEFKFQHDRVQQAAYSLMTDTDKLSIHLQIGRWLRANTPITALDSTLFEIVNHLNKGQKLITDPAEQIQLAQLNLLAGRKAQLSTAYQHAVDYFRVGIALLEPQGWEMQYELTLALSLAAAEVAYLSGRFDQMESLITVVWQQAKTLLDKIKVYEIKIQANMVQNQPQAAIRIARQALKWLGINLPTKPSQLTIQLNLMTTRLRLIGKSIADLTELPEVTDARIRAMMRLLSMSLSAAYFHAPELLPIIVLKLVNLSIKYGNIQESTCGYAIYGLILGGIAEDFERGLQFGQLAVNLIERFQAKSLKTSLAAVLVSIKCWKNHMKETLDPLRVAYQNGLENGNLEYAGYTALQYLLYSFCTGQDLAKLEQEIISLNKIMTQVKQATALHYQKLFLQIILVLRDNTENSRFFSDELTDEQSPQLFQLANDKIIMFLLHFNKLVLCYLFGKYQQAVYYAIFLENYLDHIIDTPHFSLFRFYDSLVHLAIYGEVSKSEQWRILKKVTANQQKISKWAYHAPMNFLHKFYLVEAEYYRVRGQNAKAMDLYDRAITLAKENQYLHEEALASELAAQFYLAQDKAKIAEIYLRDAHYSYSQWGAKAKVADLEMKYAPFFEKRTFSATASSVTTTITSTSHLANTLDLASVLKASQTLASEINLKQLLDKLMTIVIENAGAQRGLLIKESVAGETQWLVEAVGTIDKAGTVELQTVEPPATISFPITLINSIAHTKTSIVLPDAQYKMRFIHDPYIVKHQVKSMLGIPLLNQGRLIRILYLENALIANAFTPARLAVLNLLSSQLAISIENSSLYNQLEQKVAERTDELQQEILERQRAEKSAQVANQAKTIFLANMSHELRSPLNTILGFTQLMTLNSNLSVEQRENLDIIHRSGEHLFTLINDILDLAKIEAGRATLNETRFNLQQLLSEVEKTFQLRANDKQLQLWFKLQPNLPHYVQTDELKLRQVLINLLNNAIKFTPVGSIIVRVGSNILDNSLSRVEKKLTSQICFEIKDSGIGMSDEELDTLFKTFVQTQAGIKTKEGAGLGLAISQKLVQLMGGEIEVSSEIGKGTLFKFSITVQELEESHLANSTVTRRVIALEPGQPHYRILIVDDNKFNRQLLVKRLNPLGFELQEAMNGLEALEIVPRFQPHLIWMDLQMPVMDGYEATKRIKASTQGATTVIIAITASVLEKEQAQALAAGCDDFVGKPFQEKAIFDMMNKYLGVRYVYKESDIITKPPSVITLTPATLANLPTDWKKAVNAAAERADAALILKLVAQIQDEHADLAKSIVALVENFEFEQLISLTNLSSTEEQP